ncbi:hypothetical protein VN97_g11087 [Penicillium thymicola]|uniref:Uncharacterized protein n=1 Tax=Penicillium thymicola TaxID=293382 RepID=A0AAI9T8N3_PENTH|nr:hypothetical protein VN97_g11087 [Penicillium thymicola]
MLHGYLGQATQATGSHSSPCYFILHTCRINSIAWLLKTLRAAILVCTSDNFTHLINPINKTALPNMRLTTILYQESPDTPQAYKSTIFIRLLQGQSQTHEWTSRWSNGKPTLTNVLPFRQ